MSSKKSTALYSKLLREAWSLTWKRKMLWIFGIFAAVISTGGVIDIATATIKKVKVGGNLLEQLMSSSFFGYELASQYIHQLHQVGTGRAAGVITATTLVALMVIVMAILSQGALVLGAKMKEVPDPYQIRKEARKHFWDLLTIATLTKVTNALLVILMTLPLLLFYVETTLYSALLFFLGMIVFLPMVIIVNTISILAVIDVVHHGRSALHSLHHACLIFQRQWLAALEFGLLLFFLMFGVGFILVAIISLLSIPYAIIYTATLLSGSFALFLFANVISALLITAIILGVGGAMVSFQYLAWYQFYKRASHRVHGLHSFGLLHRLTR